MEVAKLSSDVRNEENARLLQENQNLRQMMEERNAELAIIQSVQEGLASRLDVQSIYELVGDKIREIFDAQGTAVYIFNHEAESLETPYCYLKKRFEIEARPFSEHPIAKLMVDAVQPIRYSTVEEYRALGGAVLENSDEYKSGMYVPLMVGKEIKGMLGVANLDKENAYGESDLRLLTTLANSMSVALENARLFAETEQRAAELQIINRVQEGLATKLDIEAIYELVGDKIREIFHNADTEIRIHDLGTNLIRFPYFTDQGKRIAMDPIPFTEAGVSSYVLRTGKTLVINENLLPEIEKYGAKILPGGHPAKSAVFVPLTVNNQVRGLIVLGDVEHEHAFSEADVRLLQTLANSMSTALENARLFDEVQKKNAEITEALERETGSNDILRVIAESPTNIQPVLEVIARNAAQLSGSDDAIITLRDGDILHADTHYGDIPTFPAGEGMRFNRDSVAGRAILEGRPLQAIHNQDGGKSEYPEGDKVAKKYGYRTTCAVPLMREGKAIGAISIRRIKPERLTEKQIAVIQSFANQAAIAVENVRLFNETTRLLKETEQRAAELAIINSVQEGLASKLDMQAIYDLVGDKIRDLFSAQSVWIVTLDQDTRTRQFKYSYEKGQRFYPSGVHPFNKLTEHLIATKKTLVVNQNANAIIAEFEMTPVAGTERFKSAIFVPLIAQNEWKGFISLQNIEQENAFSESDISLLSTLASSMSVALENARLFDETQHLLKETEQRAAELAIINSVQQGLSSKLDMQAIYELVGDEMQEIFDAQSLLIVTFDHSNELAHMTYNREKGTRYYAEPYPFTGLHRYLIQSRKTVVINENSLEWQAKLGMIIVPGTEPPKSMIFVPLTSGYRVSGMISLQNLEREHAFTEMDVRLLETLASSMSVALENASLFDETQRLLKETEQGNAELAIINSVQAGLAEGLASKRDMQSIYDLVGDKIRELFPNTDTEIRIYDAKTNLFHVPYYIENGQRVVVDPISLSEATMSAHVLRTGQPLVVNENIFQEMEKYGATMMRGRRVPAKSMVFVPLLVGNQGRGLIVLNNAEREHAFSNSDVRLLQTLANSMSTALENARLFDETQHLLNETEQRAAELAIINSVQEGLASKLDMQAIYDLVGDKIRDLFSAQSVWIAMFDHATRTRQFKYALEKGRRLYIPEAFPFNKLTEHLIATKKTLVINQDAQARIAEFEMVILSQGFKSAVFVPLIAGDAVKGFITLQNVEQENAFSESDISLLSTLASSMSVALENASLFDETQHLFLEAKEARMAAEQANQAKSAFLSSMSHELRTPLNAIINFVEMVARGMMGPVNGEQVELLDQALDSSKHLLNLINDVLDISKIQAGQLTLFIEDQVSVQVEVEAALNIVGGLLQEKGLQLIRDIDPHLPMISCDRRRLRQVLLNLISNAIKFTNKGTITVSVKNPNQEVLFAVIDTGPGIPPGKQDLIFEPFIQAENGERQVHGTGLGLPISRSLVRAHGGELWVDSQSGEGSAFFFTLPVDRRSTP